MKKVKILLIGLLWLFMPVKAYSQSVDEIWTRQIESLDFSRIDQMVTNIKSQKENPFLQGFDFKDIVIKSIKGELDFSLGNIIKSIIFLFFKEMPAYFSLIGKLMVISMLSAFLNSLAESFQSKSTSNVAFYVCYMVLIILLLQSFQIAIQLSQSTLENMVLIIQASLPALLTLMMASGELTSGAVYEPVLLFAIQIMGVLIKKILLPFIFFTAILSVINSLSDKNLLKKMLELFNQAIDWLIKGIAILFIALMSLSSFTAPVLDGIINRAAKTAVGVVPVVGETLTGAVDIVMNCSLLIKNAVGVGVIILLAVYCILPLIKILLFFMVYKLTAALIEPISDKRIVNCISDTGEACIKLFSLVFTSSLIFIVAITILIGIGSMTLN
ncbi:MAG TPA: stage III sporulation protein AE [Defluviitaleaceae bacterium]|jgi:stage III sporulation protein AE|nr:stage III sporulation protein AE [Defluviitaleaceae bacterium]HPT77285.1 stage III sporulation protein AE [Defluviitaleaceae bacterium]